MSMFLLVAVAAVLVAHAAKSTGKFKAFMASKSAKAQMLPKAVGMLVITAQISELVKVVEHTSIVNVSAALLLLAIIAATKTGTEGELH